jgi:hypothetical protein
MVQSGAGCDLLKVSADQPSTYPRLQLSGLPRLGLGLAYEEGVATDRVEAFSSIDARDDQS